MSISQRQDSSKTERGPKRLVIVDLVRTFSILAVLALHLGFARLYYFPKATFSTYLWFYLVRNGRYGVSAFFLISGFLISGILCKERDLHHPSVSFADFYTRRIGRVIPLLTLTLLIGFVFSTWTLPSIPKEYCFRAHALTPGLWLSILSFTFNWYNEWHQRLAPGGWGLHWDILWSLSVEEQFYFVYPFLLRRLRSLRRLTAFLWIVILFGPLARSYYAFGKPHTLLQGILSSFGAFDLIGMGCFLYFNFPKISARYLKETSTNILLLLLGVLVMVSVYLKTRTDSHLDMIYGPSLFDAGVFLVLLGGLNLNLQNHSWLRYLCFPGELSYGMYLLHTMVLFLTWGMYSTSWPWLSYFFFVNLSVAIAAASFYFFEKPANHRIRTYVPVFLHQHVPASSGSQNRL